MESETSSCPLEVTEMHGPFRLPRVCGGFRYVEGEGKSPDAVIVCMKCKARWTLDSKDVRGYDQGKVYCRD